MVSADHEALETQLGALHHEMKLGFQTQAKDTDEVKVLARETNGKVRSLELWRAMTKGALAVLGVIAASGAAWLAVLTKGI